MPIMFRYIPLPVPVVDGGTGTATGSITGTGELDFTAGGTNQNVVITPSGTGNIILNDPALKTIQL